MPATPPTQRLRHLARTLVREPVLHFTLLGAIIFIAHSAISTRANAEKYTIEVSDTTLAALRAAAVRQWGREPQAQQMQDLVQDYVREEVLVREALARGLDRDDVVVRRRLAQKMEFLAHDAVRTPDEDELRAHWQAHPERYQHSARWDLEQRYFSTSVRSPAQAHALAQQALQTLNQGQPVQGDAFMLGQDLGAHSAQTLERDFGAAFAQAVQALPAGRWSGPLESAHGVHLVRVLRQHPAQTAPFAQVRERVSADLVNQRLGSARDAAYAQWRQRYTVVLEGTAALPAQPAPVAADVAGPAGSGR